MTVSTHLKLPFIDPAQAGKHITHNEAVAALDTLTQLAVLDRDLVAPPPSPATGARYIVGPGATGDWSGKANHIATHDGAAWLFHAPEPGWLAFLVDENGLVAWSGSAWLPTVGLDGKLHALGINAAADATNRLAVKSDAVLLTHDDITPGSGDMRLKLDKSAAGGTASLLFQTGASGRAEIGTAGDDKLHVKLSPDGSAWAEALVADPATGNVGIGTAAPDALLTLSANAAATPAVPGGTIAHFVGANGAQSRFTFDSFAESSTITHRRANGTAAAPTALAAGDLIGGNIAYGYGATGYSAVSRASFRFVAEETWTDAAQGLYASVHTTAPGGVASSEKLRVTGAGNVGIGVTTPATRLDVDGPVRVKSYTVAGLPAASAGAGQIVFVSNETGGAVLAFSDGANWRRVTDRAVAA